MQRTMKSAWLCIAAACVVAILAVLILPTAAQAEDETRQVELHASMSGLSGGSVDQATVEVTNGQLGTLPTPTAPEGWTFKGWYTGAVKTTWWQLNDHNPWDKSGNLKLPAGFESLTNVRTGNSFSGSDY